jgi:hypothetical protein
LFQAVSDLRDGEYLSKDERIAVEEIFKWLVKNLPAPKRFSRSSKHSAQAVAISWFRSIAHEYIKQMQEFACIPYIHDVQTKVIKSQRQGYVVYEDEFQIVAQPFSGRK